MKKVLQRLILPLLIILVSSYILFLMINNIHEDEDEIRRLNLENTHNITIEHFSGAIDQFAGLVSGMQSFVSLSEHMPTSEEFQLFVKNQFKNINFSDSLVVSYIDTSHIFNYSFNLNEINPIDLSNTSVKLLREQKEIDFLNDLMLNDDLKLNKPLNLVEGWVGIPLDFRVYRDNEVKGYVAPFINFKTIIESIYDHESINKDFVFHFLTAEGYDFDREKVYDGSEIYNEKSDSEYYKNYNVDTTNFIYSTVNHFGMDFTIGTGYKQKQKKDTKLTLIIIVWFISIILFITIISIQIVKYIKLSDSVIHKNKTLEIKQLEIEKKNDQLEKLNDTKTKLFSIIGHDLRGPIGSVISMMEILLLQKIENSNTKDLIKRLGIAVKNTLNLLDNLLNWSRSQLGQIEYNPKTFNIDDLISDASDLLKQQAQDKLINIECNLETNLSYFGDYEMISTVVRNILSNAIKYSYQGSRILINTYKKDTILIIEIADKGIGLSEDNIKMLLEPGKHITTFGTSGEKGTGLGLMLSKEFVDIHKGDIIITSNDEEGTKFTIQLPLTKK